MKLLEASLKALLEENILLDELDVLLELLLLAELSELELATGSIKRMLNKFPKLGTA